MKRDWGSRHGRVGRWALGLGSGMGTMGKKKPDMGEVLEADAGGVVAMELTETMEAGAVGPWNPAALAWLKDSELLST